MAIASKGTIFKMDVAGSLAAIAEVLSIEIGESKSDTFETTTLTQSTSGKTKLATGYTTPGDISVEMFWIPTDTGHQAITDELTTPAVLAANQLDGSITYSNVAVTVVPFVIAGIGHGQTITKDDGVKAKCNFELTGNPVWTT